VSCRGWCNYQALAEIQRILVQDPRTKDVFRELDGLLVLMSVLSTVQEQPLSGTSASAVSRPQSLDAASSPVVLVVDEIPGEGEQDPVLADIVESMRLVFMILSEAMYKHPRNAEWFRVSHSYLLMTSA
jgi:hypothetical protein